MQTPAHTLEKCVCVSVSALQYPLAGSHTQMESLNHRSTAGRLLGVFGGVAVRLNVALHALERAATNDDAALRRSRVTRRINQLSF